MSGKNFILAFLSTVLIFSGLLFYFQNFAYYESIDKLQSVLLGEKKYEVSGYQGIDSKSSGLKLRECFSAEDANQIQLPPYKKPTPLTAPFWFKCFNAEKITKDLEDGKAFAFLSKKEEFDGIDSVIAIYPDGRIYRWRQLNKKYLKD